jgi:hypothetical protein
MEIEPTRLWWAGDNRVEPYMIEVNNALDRAGLIGQPRTDIYNRAYEAVYKAIKDYTVAIYDKRKESK